MSDVVLTINGQQVKSQDSVSYSLEAHTGLEYTFQPCVPMRA